MDKFYISHFKVFRGLELINYKYGLRVDVYSNTGRFETSKTFT
jgi:hypothetical protein